MSTNDPNRLVAPLTVLIPTEEGPLPGTPEEMFPPVGPTGLPDYLQDEGIDAGSMTRITEVVDLMHPSVLCSSCVNAHIMQMRFGENVRLDGSPFMRTVGFCTVFKSEPLPLEDIRPTVCTNYTPRSKS